jgi:hypothetical protein
MEIVTHKTLFCQGTSSNILQMLFFARFGPATKLTLRVRQPEMSHVVSVARLRSWLAGVGGSPGEQRDEKWAEGLVS